MKKFLGLVLSLLIVIPVALGAEQSKKPNIYVLATGGTIAGVGSSNVGTTYQAGQVGVQQLLDAVPEIAQLAQVQGEQIVKIGSQDMTDHVWLLLARRLNELLGRKDVDGVVIVHGTDTMEETAFFLNLTVRSDKPIVMVGAMRPSTALSADGPLNLYNAVATAAAKASWGKGVVVVMNDAVWGARDVIKSHSSAVDAFEAPNAGPLGYVSNAKVDYLMESAKRHTLNSEFDVSRLDSLPKVGIVFGHAGVRGDAVRSLIENHYDGVVYAGVGNGNIHKDVMPWLELARQKGMAVVRAARIFSGNTTQEGEVDDDQYGFVASEWTTPQKARVLLMLALTKTNDPEQIQDIFEVY